MYVLDRSEALFAPIHFRQCRTQVEVRAGRIVKIDQALLQLHCFLQELEGGVQLAAPVAETPT